MELAGARGSAVGGRRTTAEMEGVSAKARGKPWVAATEEERSRRESRSGAW